MIGYERSEKGGTEIKYQNKRSGAERSVQNYQSEEDQVYQRIEMREWEKVKYTASVAAAAKGAMEDE